MRATCKKGFSNAVKIRKILPVCGDFKSRFTAGQAFITKTKS